VIDDLHTAYVDAHHRNVLKGESARDVARVIASYLRPANPAGRSSPLTA
jgi:hypothetical protein